MSSGQDASNGAERSARELAEQVRFLESEVTDLRRRLSDSPAQNRGLEPVSPTPSVPCRPSPPRTSALPRPCVRPATRS